MKLVTKYMIGLKCKKTSKRGTEPNKFKHNEKIATIKGLAINHNSGNYAFTFEEFDEVVDFNKIVLLDDKLREVDKTDIARQSMIHKNREK
jgi:hypothetical protein